MNDGDFDGDVVVWSSPGPSIESELIARLAADSIEDDGECGCGGTGVVMVGGDVHSRSLDDGAREVACPECAS